MSAVRGAERRVLVAALLLVAAHAGYRAWATFAGWYHVDDFNFISRMAHDGLSPAVAARSYFGHVMPAAMYLTWLNQALAPWQFWLPATELVVLQVAADLALLQLLRTLFGLRPGILPPLAVFLASVISLEASIWWAAAVNLLPLELALFLGLAAHVAYLRTGRLRHAVTADAWVVAGIAFNEKTALVYGAFAIVTLCWFATGRTPRERLRTALAGRARGFGLYVLTGAVYVGVYLAVGRDFRASEARGYPLLGTLHRMVLDAYATGIVGGPVRWWRVPDQPFSLALPGDGLVLLALAALGLVGWEVGRRRRRSLRALWLPAYFLGVDVVLVLLTRASVSGPLIGLDYRFQGEVAAATALALAFATMPVRDAAEPAVPRAPSELLDHPRRVAAATAVVVLVAAWSTWGYVTYWHADTAGRQWFATLLPRLRAATTPIATIDAVVPAGVTNGVRYPENLQSRVLAGEDALAFTEVATDRVAMVDDRGRLAPAVVPPARLGRSGPHGRCGWKVQRTPVTVPLDGPVAYGGWWVRIGYLSSGDSPVSVTVGDATRSTTVRAGVHALYLAGGGRFDRVIIGGLAGGVTLCTDDVTVGRPVPATELDRQRDEDQDDQDGERDRR